MRDRVTSSCSGVCRWGFALALAMVATEATAWGQAALKPEEMAAQIVNAANKAYNEKQFPAAIERYREYLKTYSNQKDVTLARYGLALCLLEAPQKDYKVAVETLTQVVGVQEFTDRPLALYYLGLAHRGLGHEALALGIAKPPEAAQHRAAAIQQFTPAAQRFAEAVVAFAARAKTNPPPTAEQLALDIEWANRARCDQAEMLIRLEKPKEASDLLTPLLTAETTKTSKYRPFLLYLHGHASFLLKDYIAAGRSLSQLAPFADPVFGVHAQYLLARVHHVAEERDEAAALYDAVVKGYDKQKVAAQQALQNAAAMANQPDEKLRLEALVKSAPDYVSRASFYWGVLLFEQKKTAEALTRFTAFAAAYPQSPLLPEAQWRAGMCQVELRQFAPAIQILQPLVPHPQLGDRVLLWLGRAQLGAADPTQAAPYAQALAAAIASLTQAADRANQQIAQDPDAKLRRAEIMLELGDDQQLAKQFPQAAATYETAFKENHAPERNEQFLQRRATALHFAGQFDVSDQVCTQFQQAFPKSTLLPAVLFRMAENAYVRAAAIEPTNPLSKNPEIAKWFGEAVKRYQVVVDRFPEFTYAALSRGRMALAQYRLGDYPTAVKGLEAIPQADHSGELAIVPYYHADCLLRSMPTDTTDALAAGRQLVVLTAAIKSLESFVSAQGMDPLKAAQQTPDALVKLGYCYQRVAAQIAEPQERNQRLTAARQAFERVGQQFATSPMAPIAAFERANCLVEMNDPNGAINEFTKFRADPFKQSPVAPLAYLRLATLLRAQSKPAEAAAALLECRNTFEAALAADPARAAWAPLLQYHHGLATRELAFKDPAKLDVAKLAEARALFDNLKQRFANSAEAPDAAWRSGLCRREEHAPKLVAARAVLAKPDVKPEEVAAATPLLQAAVKELTESAQYFVAQAALVVQQKLAGTEIHQRMLYEAAWCYQWVADVEVDAARKKLMDEALKKQADEAAKQPVGVKGIAQVRVPDIALSAIAVQPSEKLAQDQYKALIAAKADSPLAITGRLELAETHARRNEFDPAIALLNEALTLEPAPDVEERLHLRLGVCLVAKNDQAGAFAQFAAVAADAKSLLAPEARFRAGECQVQLKAYPKAIELWLPFRDQGPLQNIAGLSDRVLLRLGHAYALAGQWDQSRQAHETLINRFAQSPWRLEARYGVAWAWQNQKQFDNAANTYQQVINETATEIAAKSQYQLALCRIEQKRLPEAANALLVVPFTYDYPEWSAVALLEAARIFQEMQQPQQAVRLLEKVVKEYPNSEWAKAAQQRLAGLPVVKRG
ncbi:MAG: tetratricopeptide repeat protein [Planctomycetota bacterium]